MKKYKKLGTMMMKKKKDFKMLQKDIRDKEMKFRSKKFSVTSLAPNPPSLLLPRTSYMQQWSLGNRQPSCLQGKGRPTSTFHRVDRGKIQQKTLSVFKGEMAMPFKKLADPRGLGE